MNDFTCKSAKFVFAATSVTFIVLATQSCAPRPPYRSPAPVVTRVPTPPSRPPPSPPPLEESPRSPLPQESKIREQDLIARRPVRPPATTSPSQETRIEQARVIPAPPAAPLPDDSSLLAKINAATTPQRAASLRLTEEGRKLLDMGEPTKALSPLEKTIAIDATNPYGYFYLAKAQFVLGRYKESLNFLDVAESRLSTEPFWLAEVHALRGENFRVLGMIQKAEASYAEALRLNSGNRTAAEALPRLLEDGQAAPR